MVSNTGYQFILLIDPDTLETVEQLELSPSDGRYRYKITHKKGGTYWVVAGTDLDNDGFICHGGEACGAFPIFESPRALDVSRPLTGRDFITSFAVDFSVRPKSAGSTIPDRGFRLLRKGGVAGKSFGSGP